jgi:hypothetical protein
MSEGADAIARARRCGNRPYPCGLAHALPRGGSFYRLQGAPDRLDLAGQEVLALGVFSEFAADDIVEVDDGDRHLFPAERLDGAEPALAGNQHTVGANDDGVQQPKLRDAPRQAVDVTHIAAMTIPDPDFRDGPAPAIVSHGVDCSVLAGRRHGGQALRLLAREPGFVFEDCCALLDFDVVGPEQGFRKSHTATSRGIAGGYGRFGNATAISLWRFGIGLRA